MRWSIKIIFVLCLLLFATGCEILTPAPRPTIPPAAAPAVTIGAAEAETLANINLSESVTLPDRDPDIVNLMEQVSEQQLIAYVQALQDFGTRNSFSETQRGDFGIGAARTWIKQEFERVGNGRMQVEFEEFTLTFPGAPSTTQMNVIATLPGVGSHPGVLVVGAHYDSRVGPETDGTSLSPSANDNASGVAMLLELARLLSSRTWNQTIVFVAFAAEEQGTAGSRYFVNNSFLNGRQIDFAVNNDAIGGRPGIPFLVRMYAPNMATSNSGLLARYADYLGSIYMPDFPIDVNNALDRENRYGDHREFVNAGIGAIRFVESLEDPSLLNSPTDTWDKIDYRYLAQVTKLNLVIIANWAGAPRPPAPPSIAPMANPGSYLVTWSKDLQAAGYAIAFRPLNQLDLPQLRFVSAADAGQVVVDGLDPNMTYAVSIAPVGPSGRLGGFSSEVVVP